MPRVTVGLPVFNGERFVRKTLESILQQSYADFELLVGDNASTDSTLSICREFAFHDPRVRILTSDVNLGAAPNYNRLVDEAAGTYFRWVAHDDFIAPTFLAQCVGYLDAHPDVILCYPSTCPVDEQGAPLSRLPEDSLEITSSRPSLRLRQYFDTSFENRQCNAVLGVVRTEVLRRTGLIGPYTGSDKVLLAELALQGPFHQLPEVLFFRRYHTLNSASTHPNPAERDGWFDSSKKTRHAFPQWMWFREFLGAIRRARLPFGEELACYAEMGHYARLYRYALWNEVKWYIRPRDAR